MTKEQLQKLFIEFQELSQMMQQLEKQNTLLSNQLLELTLAKQNLEELKSIKKGTEILVPVSSGVYAKAELKENTHFLVNVGADVTLKKDGSAAQDMIQKQADEIKKLQESLEAEMQENSMKAKGLEQQIRVLASKK